MNQQQTHSMTRRQQMRLPPEIYLSAASDKRLFSYAGKIKGVQLVKLEDLRFLALASDKMYYAHVRKDHSPSAKAQRSLSPLVLGQKFGEAIEVTVRSWLGKQFVIAEERGILYEKFIRGRGGRGEYVCNQTETDAIAKKNGLPWLALEIKSSCQIHRKYEARHQLMLCAEVLAVPWPAIRAAVVYVDTRIDSQPNENFLQKKDGVLSINIEALTARMNRLPIPVVTLSLDEVSQIAISAGHPIPENLLAAAKRGFAAAVMPVVSGSQL